MTVWGSAAPHSSKFSNWTNNMKHYNEKTGKWELLVDRRNVAEVMPFLMNSLHQLQNTPLIGFDIETEDSKRHDGLNQFMALDPESEDFKRSKKLVFDLRRTNITGFSLYPEGHDYVYYFNTGHLDEHNRLTWDECLPLLELIKQKGVWTIHNATFEIAQMMASVGFDIGKNYLCSMQLCVSAYNDDEYSVQSLANADLGSMAVLIPEISRVFAGYQPRTPLSTEQNETLQKVIGKQSKAKHSYNGYIRQLAYGYGLKKAVKSWFGYEQTTFEEALQGRAHMGLLTGEEILHYGADDAYWCVELAKRVIQFIQNSNPPLLQTFFKQENPMPRIFAQSWVRGIRLNYPNIQKRKDEARSQYAQVIRELSKAMQCFSFTEHPCPRMVEKQTKWYVGKPKVDKKTGEETPANKWVEYRQRIQSFISLDVDSLSDYDIVKTLSGAVTSNWMNELKEKIPKSQLNLTHYMSARVLYHDLMNLPFVYVKGQIQSGVDARGKLKEYIQELNTGTTRWMKELSRWGIPTPEGMTREQYAESLQQAYPAEAALAVMKCLDRLTSIEQTMKLYLNPYLMLVDPETDRIYPTISSLLNTRRMASENPNTMQLAKRSEATFVRGFFKPERDDHVYVGVDWSQVELVLIGEESKDPGFHAAYGQIPYNDLHLGAAASAIKVYYPTFTEYELKDMRTDNVERVDALKQQYPQAFINPVKGIQLDGKKAYKFWRGEAGKNSNFGYWYSGSLMTVQEKLGWTTDQMWKATENYRSRFPVAEQWRQNTIEEVKMDGYVTIFDHHRRVRLEATTWWKQTMMAKWSSYGNPALTAFGELMTTRIAKRAGNQAVNAKIQGGCATLAKRSIIKLVQIIEDEGWDACFIMPIHDELVFSVHKDQAVAFSERIKEVMCDHPDLVVWLKLDGTASIGLTLEPYHPEKAPTGQIELDEAPVLDGYITPEWEGKALPMELRQRVVDYLFEQELQ